MKVGATEFCFHQAQIHNRIFPITDWNFSWAFRTHDECTVAILVHLYHKNQEPISPQQLNTQSEQLRALRLPGSIRSQLCRVNQQQTVPELQDEQYRPSRALGRAPEEPRDRGNATLAARFRRWRQHSLEMLGDGRLSDYLDRLLIDVIYSQRPSFACNNLSRRRPANHNTRIGSRAVMFVTPSDTTESHISASFRVILMFLAKRRMTN